MLRPPALPAPLLAGPLLAAPLLAGCWKPVEEMATLDFTEVPYDAPGVDATDAKIRTYETGLPCPDGTDARFYVAWTDSMTEPVPAVVLFHSGAFDYALQPDAEPTDELYGRTWRSESRLTRDWADRMAWETLGMYPRTVEPSEVHTGALPAAFIDAGVPVIVPGNCWADLWHNEEGFQDNDFALEAFSRNGRTFAWWMVRLLFDEAFVTSQGVELPFTHDGRLYLAGLGDGSRGVVELLSHEGMRPVAGVLLDSAPDTLSAWQEQGAGLDEAQVGLQRIFATEESYEAIDQWSLLAALQTGPGGPPAPPLDTPPLDTGALDTGGPLDTGLEPGDGGDADSGTPGDGGDDSPAPPDLTYTQPARIAFVWSEADPRQPRASTERTADYLAERQGPSVYVADAHARAHVLTNRDDAAADALVAFLLGGDVPELDWAAVIERSEPAPESADTGSDAGTESGSDDTGSSR